MNYKNVLEYFFNEVPELKLSFEKQKKVNLIDYEAGNYVIWGMGVLPCIIKLFENFDSNKTLLIKIFIFFEKMACSEDEELKELLMYSILENIGDDKAILEKAMSIMGKETLIYLKDIDKFLGR